MKHNEQIMTESYEPIFADSFVGTNELTNLFPYPSIIPVTNEGVKANYYYLYFVSSNRDASKETNTDKKIKVLKEAVLGYKKTLDYNGLYISYLLEQISDEEFMQESENYAIKLSRSVSYEIKEKIRLLIKITGESFTPSEISNLFSIEENLAENILHNIEKNDQF